MSTLKYSRQRESIKVCLQGRKDHPTADMLYTDVRKEFPNISLGTVYRNLSLLSELGEIKRLTTGDGPDRFDGDTSTHHHFICRKCHCVTDLTMRDISEIKNVAAENFRGTIEDYSVNFYGICENCKNHPGNVQHPQEERKNLKQALTKRKSYAKVISVKVTNIKNKNCYKP